MVKRDKSNDRNGKTPKGPCKITILSAEFIGTALLLFVGCMTCVTELSSIPTAPHFISIGFGLVVMFIIQIFGHISGAHLNPVVTAAALLLGCIHLDTVPSYLGGQFVGAIVGFGMLLLLTPNEYMATSVFDPDTNSTIRRFGICSTVPHPKMGNVESVVVESLITAVLILVCAAIWDKRNEKNTDSIPIKFGLVIACLGMAAGPYTGASMNPARSFAPALLNGDWDKHWIYWIGPFVGGIGAAGLYKILYQHENDTEILEVDDAEPEEVQLQNNVHDNKTDATQSV